MSKQTKAQRKESRAKIRAVMAQNDASVRDTWKRPPFWVSLKELFKPGSVDAWTKARELDHERRQRKAFRKVAQMMKRGEVV